MLSLAARFAVLAAVSAAVCLGSAPAFAASNCVRTITAGESVRSLIRDLEPGQTGCLSGGTFVEDVTIRVGGTAGAPITLAAAPGATPTLRGRLWIADSANWVTVEGLILDGRNGRDLPSPTVHGDHVTFRNNEVTNHRAGAGGEGHGICFLLGSADGWGIAHDTLLEDNRIHDCGISDNHNHGIYIEGSRGARIVGNLIYDNGDRGIQFYPDAHGTLVEGNVIDGNGSGILFSGNAGLASSGNRVIGNVISNSRTRYNIESWYPEGNPAGHDNLATRNCLWNGERGDISAEWGFTANANTIADPRFVNRATQDFRLPSNSRCAAIVAGHVELLAVSATTSKPAAARKRPARAIASTTTAAFSAQLIAAINDYRARNGLRRLNVNRRLASAASFHAESMVTRGFFSHDSHDGTSAIERIRRFSPTSNGVGENILWSSGTLTVKRALQMWLSSPGHRQVILTPFFRHIGLAVGTAPNAPGVFGGLDATVVVADFGG